MILPFEKIYCLNISKAPDRKKYMEIVFRQNNIENNIIFTEYTDLDFLKYTKHNKEIYKVFYNIFDDNSIGIDKRRTSINSVINCLSCLLNHYQIIKYNYDIGTNTICVFEDDIAITDKELFEYYLNNMPDDWDIIRFGVADWCNFSKDPNLYNKKKYKFITGTQCYAMNRNGMKCYIDYINNRIEYADFMLTHIDDKCNVYCVKDKFIISNNNYKSIIV